MVNSVANGCTNRSEKPAVTFHSFPKDAAKRKLWPKAVRTRAVRRKDWEPNNQRKICSAHFRAVDIDRMSLSCVRIRDGAIPCIFPAFPLYLQNEILPQWKIFVLGIEESVDVPEVKSLNFLVEANLSDEFRQWLAQFQEKSKTFSVRHTEPAVGKKVAFKQRFSCQHNMCLERIHDPAIHKVTKNTNCPSKMTVTIHAVCNKYQGKSVEKSQFYEQMLCEINLMLNHNRTTSSAAALRFRTPSDGVKEKLIALFQRGHSPATALECIKTDIQLSCVDFPLVLADRSKCPDYDFCYHLYTKIFHKKYGPMDFRQEGKKLLQQRSDEYNCEVGTVCYKMVVNDDDDYVICICSPLMQRVHLYIKAASRMVFMDSTGCVDNDGSRIFVLLTHSVCGGLPLGITVTSTESCKLLEIRFQILKELLGENIFGGKIHDPSAFLTDDSQAEQNAMRRTFPASKTLCVFHVLQAVWRWLTKSKNGMPQEKQIENFKNFKKIVQIFALVRSEGIRNHYYIVNISVLICTCLKGNSGNICKHIDWESTVRPSEKYTEVISTDSVHRTFYSIATGVEAPVNWLVPLCGSGSSTGLNDVPHSEPMDTEEPTLATEKVVEEVIRRTNSDLIHGIQTLMREFSDRSPVEISKGLEVMYETLKKVKMPSAFASHLMNIGGGQSRKNHRNYIPVQPTAIARRKMNLAGCRSRPGGGPRKSACNNKYVVTSENSNNTATNGSVVGCCVHFHTR